MKAQRNTVFKMLFHICKLVKVTRGLGEVRVDNNGGKITCILAHPNSSVS